ncbi:MAG: hypothetical protein IPP96_15715 [Chitinophagaceae bacterium]|nr:hypothetical protein [Chitinophagaceae bacterium]
MASIVLMLCFASLTHAQNKLVASNTSPNHLSPLLVSSFKKPVKPIENLNEYFKSPDNQLMFWPNYPLTAAQIEARQREWDRRNSQSLGQQIAGDIAESYIKSLINGINKKPVANVPKF